MTAKIKTINYVDLVEALLANLSDRERQVLQKRNALATDSKFTLEQIGKDFNITRERVRQIEKEGLRKLRNLDFEKIDLPVDEFEDLISDYLNTHGGIMSENHLIDKILKNQETEAEKSLNFVLANILGEKFERIPSTDEHYIIIKLADKDLAEVLEIALAIKDMIENHGSPLHLDDIIDKFKSHAHYQTLEDKEAEINTLFEAILNLRKDLGENVLDQWGIAHWNTIKPKRMTDKAYLIMLKENRPLHFVEVADLINEVNFDRKKAHPATVHNELILDDKYVLVGRGIYALKDWGYKEGTVADIIENILKKDGPMSKKDLSEQVLKQRLVQKTTITLVLMNKDRFARLEDGNYSLVK